MLGRRGGGPISRGARFVIGAIASLVGAGVLWLAMRISAGEVEGATDDPTLAYIFAIAMLSMGLTVFIGAVVGVGDRGERPETIGQPMRILLDALGYVFGFAFAAMMAYWALTPEAPLIARFAFGLFALLIGGASAYALIESIVRSIRKR